MRGISYLLLLPLALAFAACAEQPNAVPDSTTDATADPTSDLLNYSTPCSTVEINALIDQIFERPVVRVAFKVSVNLYIRASTTGPRPAARARLFNLVDQLLKVSDTVTDPVKLKRIESLIRLLYCILGETAPPLDLVNGDAAVVTPTTGATVAARCTVDCGAGLNDAATKVEPGDLPASVPSAVVSITPITAENPLDTPLQQRGPFYEFTVTPNVTFAQPVLVGVCLNKFVPEPDARNEQIRLAHNLDPSLPVTDGNIRFGNIEIISPAGTLADLNLACDPLVVGLLERALDWLLPEKLYAGGFGTGGRGGLVSNYSPFGGVVPEPLTTGLGNWLYQQPSTGNPEVPSTTISGAPVPFFAAGGATTPSTGAVWQGTWGFGTAPFGETQNDGVSFTSQCNGSNGTVNYALGTASLWQRASIGATSDASLFTYLYARRVFHAANTTDKVRLLLDNDIRVWINGAEVTEYTVNGSTVNVAPGAFLLKEGCAKTNQVLVSVPRTGVNVISVQARDRGVASYFDATQASVAPEFD
jgi:hypothetical protein